MSGQVRRSVVHPTSLPFEAPVIARILLIILAELTLTVSARLRYLGNAGQDTFLDHVRKHDVPVTVFLANGIRLQGTVAGFDSYSLLLVRDRQSQLIYKHAISTILPSEPDRMAQVSDRQGTSQNVRSRPA